MSVRTIVDGDGCPWTVWATYPSSTSQVGTRPEYTGGWLSFQCDGEKRRLAPVPDGWDQEPDTRLLVYLQGAVVMLPRPARDGT